MIDVGNTSLRTTKASLLFLLLFTLFVSFAVMTLQEVLLPPSLQVPFSFYITTNT